MRPEDFIVWNESELNINKDNKNMLPGVVEQVIYKGSTVDLIIKLPSNRKIFVTKFFNEDDERLDYYTAEKVWIDWIPGWEVILPYEDEA